MQQIYSVSFFKRLTDSTGHPVDAWQGAVEVRAPSQDGAIELARNRFAELKDVGVWSLRADYENVERLRPAPGAANPAWRTRREEVASRA